MRKFKFLLFSIVLAGAAAFTSCSADELLNVPELDKPVVTVNADGKSIDEITGVNAGNEVPVTVRFDMGAQKDRLERIKIMVEIGNKPYVVLDSALNTGIFNRGDKMFERKYNIAVGQAISKVTFEAIDAKGRPGSKTITVKPLGTQDVPKVKTAVLLAGQLNTTAPYGGFYSVSLGKDYKLKDAITNAPYMDFVYYYGSSDEATLAPISDDRLLLVGDIKDDIAKFVQRNATLLGAATMADWNSNVFPTVTLSALGQKHLAADKVLAFQTVLGLKGLIKVNKIMGTSNTGSDRAIEISVKVLN